MNEKLFNPVRNKEKIPKKLKINFFFFLEIALIKFCPMYKKLKQFDYHRPLSRKFKNRPKPR